MSAVAVYTDSTEVDRLWREVILAEGVVDRLWQDSGKPSGKAWFTLAARELEAFNEAEVAFAPVFLEWAEANGCGIYGGGRLWRPSWKAERTCYVRIREGTRIQAPSHRLRSLLNLGGDVRADNEQREFVRAMRPEEWRRWLDGFCVTTDEGMELRGRFIALRAELHPDEVPYTPADAEDGEA